MGSRQAVVTLVPRSDGKLLGISRGLAVVNVAIPGGNVEASDASLAHAAARELYEETGVVVTPDDLVPVFRGGSASCPCTAFVAQRAQIPPVLESVPFEGFVGWHPPASFLRRRCSYRDYHQHLFQLLEIVP